MLIIFCSGRFLSLKIADSACGAIIDLGIIENCDHYVGRTEMGFTAGKDFEPGRVTEGLDLWMIFICRWPLLVQSRETVERGTVSRSKKNYDNPVQERGEILQVSRTTACGCIDNGQ